MSDVQRTSMVICRERTLTEGLKNPSPEYYIHIGPIKVLNGAASLNAELIQKMGALNPYDDLISMCTSHFKSNYNCFSPAGYVIDYITNWHTLRKGIILEFFTNFSFKVILLASSKPTIEEVQEVITTIENRVKVIPGLMSFLPFTVFFQIENQDEVLMTINFVAGEEKVTNVRTINIA